MEGADEIGDVVAVAPRASATARADCTGEDPVVNAMDVSVAGGL